MFNRKLKEENKMLRYEVELYKDLFEKTTNKYDSLYQETKNIFTYNDAMEILNARLEYMEDKYNEVKGSGLVEATQRYYYQKTELEKIIWVLMEKGKQKDKKITKHTFKKMVVSDE